MKKKVTMWIVGGIITASAMGLGFNATVGNAAAQEVIKPAMMQGENQMAPMDANGMGDMMKEGDMQKHCMEMMKNPQMQAKMQEMMKNPEVQAEMQEMMKTPEMQSMMRDIIREMMKSPEMRSMMKEILEENK